MSTASPIVCESESPASAAAKVWRTVAPGPVRYRYTVFATRNTKSAAGSSENAIRGGSMSFGAAIIAADQSVAPATNSRFSASANQGIQPAR